MLSLYSLQKWKAYHNLHINDSNVTHMLLPEALCLCYKAYYYYMTQKFKILTSSLKYVCSDLLFLSLTNTMENYFQLTLSSKYTKKAIWKNLWSLYISCFNICFRCVYNDCIFSSVYLRYTNLYERRVWQVTLTLNFNVGM